MRRRFMLTSTAAILILAVSYATAALAGNPATPVLAQGSTVQNVNVTFDEWSISARQMAVRANQPVHFTLYNAGTESHRLSVGRGDDDAVSSPSSRPGQDPAVLDMTFDTPGVYQVWCPFETDGVQHRDLGMVATLTIVPEEDTPVVEVPISEGNYYIQSRAVSA
ncbi:MAG: Cupredoxin-like domain, partial [Chloroflexota bacterium]|nr:Cupredoxin-like domain [Chloroflexota bacterium]